MQKWANFAKLCGSHKTAGSDKRRASTLPVRANPGRVGLSPSRKNGGSRSRSNIQPHSGVELTSSAWKAKRLTVPPRRRLSVVRSFSLQDGGEAECSVLPQVVRHINRSLVFSFRPKYQ